MSEVVRGYVFAQHGRSWTWHGWRSGGSRELHLAHKTLLALWLSSIIYPIEACCISLNLFFSCEICVYICVILRIRNVEELEELRRVRLC